MRIFLTCLILYCVGCMLSVAQAYCADSDTVSLYLHFARNGSVVDAAYANNGQVRRALKAVSDSPRGIVGVTGSDSASDEGGGRISNVISSKRAAALSVDGPKVKFAVKTNILYDAALIPNFGVEVGFARNYSADINWEYAWWSKKSAHRFWRIYGGDIELRRWWLPRTHNSTDGCLLFTGHHAGIYYQMLTYDIEFGNRGYMGDRWSHAIGVSYGYSLSLNRHFNIDFSLGIGYLWGEYKRYHVEDDCYVWDSTNNCRWFGPTKAGISLVYIFGNKGARKGGAR